MELLLELKRSTDRSILICIFRCYAKFMTCVSRHAVPQFALFLSRKFPSRHYSRKIIFAQIESNGNNFTRKLAVLRVVLMNKNRAANALLNIFGNLLRWLAAVKRRWSVLFETTTYIAIKL